MNPAEPHSPEHPLRLYKAEKLCSQTDIETLFGRRPNINAATFPVQSSIAYPLRIVWRVNTSRHSGVRFLISVPKRRLRHAVDRVTIRRRIREAYRLSRHLLPPELPPVDMAFIYVADDATIPYSRILPAVRRLIGKLQQPSASDDN